MRLVLTCVTRAEVQVGMGKSEFSSGASHQSLAIGENPQILSKVARGVAARGERNLGWCPIGFGVWLGMYIRGTAMVARGKPFLKMRTFFFCLFGDY